MDYDDEASPSGAGVMFTPGSDRASQSVASCPSSHLGYNAVDRHVLDGHGGRAALIYFNERGERVVQTYA